MRNRPVYPHLMSHCQVQNESEMWPGIVLPEHAAITLRVPNSGDEHIDAMIRQANRRDAAVAAMQGLLANASVQSWDEYAETPRQLAEACALQSVLLADALLARLEEKQ